ncbi:hypothetical protein GT002_06170 [Streptomyces sp. SID4917]|uniref:hypothetical protein n=1 Tax=Streptomyces sp. MnatMP-M17 TaxID=1839780 RepID=UPI000B88FA74|nr:hypothetical protein [Streptomyces sp. MnatMP-M17]MYZ34701.1 hypothetical protein [Streptomyces sp. SID4917]
MFDPRTDIPGVVAVFHDPTVRIVRPSGRTWYATRISVRPATDREKRQLRALAEHRRKQLALMGSQP